MHSTSQDAVVVRVFGSRLVMGGDCGGGCSCGCGSSCCGSDDQAACSEDKSPMPPMSMEEQVKDLGTTISRYYGDQVQVEYVDVFGTAMSGYPDIIRLMAQRGLFLPLVTINGEPRFVGGLPLDEITRELEALGVAPLSEA